ncbi:MAG: hypothetical protein HOM96_03695 [Rickettsiales bacterium]|nr:hypothetical protein [Rickettsiales bacterium]
MFQLLGTTPNCIEAIDFGDIVSVKINLKVNPMEWDPDDTEKSDDKRCQDAAAGTEGYVVEYYNTGVDYTNTNNPLSIKAHGYGDFCSTSFATGYEKSDNSDCANIDCSTDSGSDCCTLSVQEDAGECKKSSILIDSSKNGVQPFFADNELTCSADGTANSSFKFQNHDEFLVLVAKICLPNEDSDNASCGEYSSDYKDKKSGGAWNKCSACTAKGFEDDPDNACSGCNCVIKSLECNTGGGALINASGICECTAPGCTEAYKQVIDYEAGQIDFINSAVNDISVKGYFDYATTTNFAIDTTTGDGVCSKFEYQVMQSYKEIKKLNDDYEDINFPEAEMKRMALDSVRPGFIVDSADKVTADNGAFPIMAERVNSNDKAEKITLDTDCNINACSLAKYECVGGECDSTGSTTTLCKSSEAGYKADVESCSAKRDNYNSCIANKCEYYHDNMTLDACLSYCDDYASFDLGYESVTECFDDQTSIEGSTCYTDPTLKYQSFGACVGDATSKDCEFYNEAQGEETQSCYKTCKEKSETTGDDYYGNIYDCIIGDKSHCKAELDACEAAAGSNTTDCQAEFNICDNQEICTKNCVSSSEDSNHGKIQTQCCLYAGGKTCLTDSDGNDTQYWNQKKERVYIYKEPSNTNTSSSKSIEFKLGDEWVHLHDEDVFTLINKDECACLFDSNVDCTEEDVCYEISVSDINVNEFHILHYDGIPVNGWFKARYNKPHTENRVCLKGGGYHSSSPFSPHWQMGWDHAWGDSDVSWDWSEWDLVTGYDRGCWWRDRTTSKGFWGTIVWYSAFKWEGREYVYNNYQNNLGSGSATIYTLDTCTGGSELVRIKIGDEPEVTLAELSRMSSSKTIPDTGRIYARIADSFENEEGECFVDNQTEYDFAMKNNSGSFLLNIVTVEDEIELTNIVPYIVEPFNYLFNSDFQESVFANLVGEGSYFQAILKIVVTLYISFMGLMFVAGLSNISQGELVSRLIRIGIVYMFVSPGGWEFFYTYIIQFFEGGAEDLAELFTYAMVPEFENEDLGVMSSFVVFDYFFYYLLQEVILIKLVAILFSPLLIGWLLFALVFGAVLCVIASIILAICYYVMFKVILAILFIIGPIFFIFLVFESTKQFFRNWLNMIISYSLQLAMLFFVINIFGYMLLAALFDVFSFGVCWGTILSINLPGIPPFEMLSFWRAAGIDPRYSAEYNAAQTISFYSAAYFFALGYFFLRFTDSSAKLADSIAGGGAAGVTMSDIAGGLSKYITSSMKSAASMSAKVGFRTAAFGGKMAYKTAMPIARGALAVGSVAAKGALKTGFSAAKGAGRAGFSAAKGAGYTAGAIGAGATGTLLSGITGGRAGSSLFNKSSELAGKAIHKGANVGKHLKDTGIGTGKEFLGSGKALTKEVVKLGITTAGVTKDLASGKIIGDSVLESNRKKLRREFGEATGMISDKEAMRRKEQQKRFNSGVKKAVKEIKGTSLSDPEKMAELRKKLGATFKGDEKKVNSYIDRNYSGTVLSKSLQAKMGATIDNKEHTRLGRLKNKVGGAKAFVGSQVYKKRMFGLIGDKQKAAKYSDRYNRGRPRNEYDKYKDDLRNIEGKLQARYKDKDSPEYKEALHNKSLERLQKLETGSDALLIYQKEIGLKELELKKQHGSESDAYKEKLKEESTKLKDKIYESLKNRGIDGEMKDEYSKYSTIPGLSQSGKYKKQFGDKEEKIRQNQAGSAWGAKDQFRAQEMREQAEIEAKKTELQGRVNIDESNIQAVEKNRTKLELQMSKLKDGDEEVREVYNTKLKNNEIDLEAAKDQLARSQEKMKRLESHEIEEAAARFDSANKDMKDMGKVSGRIWGERDLDVTQNVVDAEIFKQQVNHQEFLDGGSTPPASGPEASGFTDDGSSGMPPPGSPPGGDGPGGRSTPEASGFTDDGSSGMPPPGSPPGGDGFGGGPDGGPSAGDKARKMFLDSEKQQLDKMQEDFDEEARKHDARKQALESNSLALDDIKPDELDNGLESKQLDALGKSGDIDNLNREMEREAQEIADNQNALGVQKELLDQEKATLEASLLEQEQSQLEITRQTEEIAELSDNLKLSEEQIINDQELSRQEQESLLMQKEEGLVEAQIEAQKVEVDNLARDQKEIDDEVAQLKDLEDDQTAKQEMLVQEKLDLNNDIAESMRLGEVLKEENLELETREQALYDQEQAIVSKQEEDTALQAEEDLVLKQKEILIADQEEKMAVLEQEQIELTNNITSEQEQLEALQQVRQEDERLAEEFAATQLQELSDKEAFDQETQRVEQENLAKTELEQNALLQEQKDLVLEELQLQQQQQDHAALEAEIVTNTQKLMKGEQEKAELHASLEEHTNTRDQYQADLSTQNALTKDMELQHEVTQKSELAAIEAQNSVNELAKAEQERLQHETETNAAARNQAAEEQQRLADEKAVNDEKYAEIREKQIAYLQQVKDSVAEHGDWKKGSYDYVADKLGTEKTYYSQIKEQVDSIDLEVDDIAELSNRIAKIDSTLEKMAGKEYMDQIVSQNSQLLDDIKGNENIKEATLALTGVDAQEICNDRKAEAEALILKNEELAALQRESKNLAAQTIEQNEALSQSTSHLEKLEQTNQTNQAKRDADLTTAQANQKTCDQKVKDEEALVTKFAEDEEIAKKQNDYLKEKLADDNFKAFDQEADIGNSAADFARHKEDTQEKNLQLSQDSAQRDAEIQSRAEQSAVKQASIDELYRQEQSYKEKAAEESRLEEERSNNIVTMKEQNASLGANIDTSKDERDRALEENANMKLANEERQEERERELSKQQKELIGLDEKVRDEQTKIEQTQQDQAAIDQDNAERTEAIKIAQAEHDAKAAEVSSQETKMNEHKKAHEQKETRLAEKEEEIQAQLEAREALEMKIEEDTQRLQARSEKQAEANNLLKEHEAEMEASQKSYNDRAEELNQKEMEVNDLESQIGEKNTNNEAKQAELEAQIAVKKQEKEQLTKELEAQNAEIQKAHDDKLELERQREERAEALANEKEAIALQEQELADRKVDLDTQNKAYEIHQDEIQKDEIHQDEIQKTDGPDLPDPEVDDVIESDSSAEKLDVAQDKAAKRRKDNRRSLDESKLNEYRSKKYQLEGELAKLKSQDPQDPKVQGEIRQLQKQLSGVDQQIISLLAK